MSDLNDLNEMRAALDALGRAARSVEPPPTARENDEWASPWWTFYWCLIAFTLLVFAAGVWRAFFAHV